MTEPEDPLAGIQEKVTNYEAEINVLEEAKGQILEEIQDARGRLGVAKDQLAEVDKQLKDLKSSYRTEAKAIRTQLDKLTRVRAPYKRRTSTPETPES